MYYNGRACCDRFFWRQQLSAHYSAGQRKSPPASFAHHRDENVTGRPWLNAKWPAKLSISAAWTSGTGPNFFFFCFLPQASPGIALLIRDTYVDCAVRKICVKLSTRILCSTFWPPCWSESVQKAMVEKKMRRAAILGSHTTHVARTMAIGCCTSPKAPDYAPGV